MRSAVFTGISAISGILSRNLKFRLCYRVALYAQETAVEEVCLNAMLDWLSATHLVKMQVAARARG